MPCFDYKKCKKKAADQLVGGAVILRRFTLYGGGLLPPPIVIAIKTADGLKPIRTMWAFFVRWGGYSVRWGLAPTANIDQDLHSGWTEAHPYGGGLLPPQFDDYANKADGLKPIRTVGACSHRNRPMILVET